MKKILAIVLALAMLLSMVVVGTSAATRESYKDDDTENKYWHFQQGSSWHPVKFSNPATEVEFDVMLDDATSSLGCYGLSNAPSLGASYVGLKDNSISVPYTFTPGEWYNVKWVSAEGATEIFVNGESVGTVAAEISYYEGNQFYWAPVLLSMDNVKNGGQVFDFEGDNSAWNTESGQGECLAEVFEGATHNELVATADNKYWHFQQGNSWHPVKFPTPDAHIAFDVKFDDASSSLGCFGTSNAPALGINYIGLKDQSQSFEYNFTPGVWYTVEWYSNQLAEGFTTVYVNGELEGNIPAEISFYEGDQFYWNPVLLSMDNVSGCGTTFDFEGDNSAWNSESGQGELLAEEVETLHQDLGAKYYHFQTGNSWHPVKFAEPTKWVSFDVCLDDASSSLGCYGLSNAPALGASYVGLKDSSISVPYTFTPGTWYNIEYVGGENSTTIYVDGVFVGIVNAPITFYENNQFYWAPVLLSMDNVKMGEQVFDFEGDLSAWNSESTQGECLEYPPAVQPTIFDMIPAIGTPEGEGLLLSNSFDAASTYYDIDSMAGSSQNVIVDFNLKLYSMSSERVAMPNHWYEFWLDSSCRNRVQIGVDTIGMDRAGSADKVAFNFGEDTWHRVTVEILKKYNTINIYIDGEGEPVYTGTCGEMHWLNGLYLIGQAVGASCLIDNYNVYSAEDYTLQRSGFGGGVDNTVNERMVADVDNPCNAPYVWHLPATTVIDTAETCHSVGKDVTTCAICGATVDHEIAKIAHKWSAYDINRKTADGLVYNYCRNADYGICSDCGERHYTTLPANYEGTLYQFHDFQDDFIFNCNSGWTADSWTVADGKLNFKKYGTNYNQFDFNRDIPTNSWSWWFDITFDSLYDDEHAGYGDEVYFWFGGQNTVAIMAGYQFKEWYTTSDQSDYGLRDTGYFFIRPADGGSFMEQRTPYEIEFGKTYNFGITFEYDEDEWTGAVKLWLDGEVVCQYTDAEDEEIIFVIPYASSTVTHNVWRDFGVVHSIDNFAYGSADFRILPVLGDVDGDGVLTAADVVAYRRYFSAQADAINLAEVAEADMNGDGVVNAKDLLALRQLLAA